MTSEADRRLLLTLARDAIGAHVNRQPMPVPSLTGVLAQVRGGVLLHDRRRLQQRARAALVDLGHAERRLESA